jgi:hypothetical protein
MADSELTDLTAATTLAATDVMYAVVDPAGTPLDRKVAVSTVRNATAVIGPPAITSVEAWVRPGGGGGAAWTAMTQNLLTLRPCLLRAGTLIGIATQTNTFAAGSFYRVGIYSEASGGGPGALLIDAGQIDFTASSGFKSIVISQAVTAGVYWMASVQQGAASGAAVISEIAGTTNIQAMMPVRWAGSGDIWDRANQHFTQASVSGALPASITLSGLTAVQNVLTPITLVRYG